MKSTIDLESLVEYGVKAPSGHNTQPWLFSIGNDEIRIYPDFSRALPVVDSDNHALYISLGCAVENIVLAATKYKLRSVVTIEKGNDKDWVIVISFVPDESIQKDELVNYIEKRQSTRNKYNDKQVPAGDLKKLRDSIADFQGVEMETLTGQEENNKLEPLIIEGSTLQFQNKEFVDELIRWIRFTDSNAKEKADGLWSKCMGLPNIPRFLGIAVMKYFTSAKSEAKRWRKLIDATAGFALFTVDTNDVKHWVELGRAFQRFGLTATELGISHAHVNMPCEEPEVRNKLSVQFDLDSRHPLLLIRFGYSEKMPYSLRRDVKEVITD